ncbi:FadR/GntR family transcriptional regulator [Sphingomonas sp. KR1UV-12]|uniref:FadR/GntR family transcriptional regulator n=1 Tax=Sphingomonas aurea TaxID=3063994 RepID=A0ABT9EMI2_9SPHN|nr:FadR/GntR family transcriptional regulator [Sphingomonas sp. KR1UV-12]MDP1028027.1 FadR/GntR family transcriptional regulator [Sphingomonas sp. KR1UV-12]
MKGSRIVSPRIHGTIAHDIGVEIVGGRRRPGTVFGGEIEASEALGVSRSAYREAIRILAAKGLVESRPKAGTRVTPRDRWNLLDPDVLAWTFEGEPDPDFIQDLFELRAVIEPAACAFAARRRSDDDLAEMKAALDLMEKTGLASPEGRAADQRFHRVVLSAARNEPLTALASTVGAAVRWTTEFKQRRRQLPRNPLPDHVRVYEAIVARDADTARSVMVELLRLAIEDMGLQQRA